MPTPLDAYMCPGCGDLVSTVRRHTWSTVARAAAIFIGLSMLWLLTHVSPLPRLIAGAAAAATLAAFGALVIYAVTAPIAKNHCKACGHRWR
jgi:hypothetical protein